MLRAPSASADRCSPGPPPAGWASSASGPLPLADQPGEPLGPQPAHEHPAFGCPAPVQVGGEGFQVRAGGCHQPAGHLRQSQLVDVEVPHRGGQVAEPLEGRLPPVAEDPGQRRPAQLQRRPRPADRHAEVVQELRVHVAEQAREVVQHRGEELPQRLREQQPGRRRGAGVGCGSTSGSVLLGTLDRAKSLPGQEPQRSPRLVVVAAQRVHPQLGPSGGGAGGLVQLEPDDDLLVLVAQLHRAPVPPLLRVHHQRAYAGHRRHRVTHRT